MVIFDKSATSQRRHNFVKIFGLFLTNLRRRSVVAASSKFIDHFLTNIRRRRFVKSYWSFFDQSATSQRRRLFVKLYLPFFYQSLTLLRRHTFVRIHWLLLTKLRRRSDLADSSKFIGYFQTSQICQNLLVIFRRSFVADWS